jgi:hypothetical protein
MRCSFAAWGTVPLTGPTRLDMRRATIVAISLGAEQAAQGGSPSRQPLWQSSGDPSSTRRA